MTEDISRRAVLVLVMIAVVVSILSTSLVLNAVYNPTYFPQQEVSEQEVVPTARAVLSVDIPPEPSFTAGVARLEVLNP